MNSKSTTIGNGLKTDLLDTKIKTLDKATEFEIKKYIDRPSSESKLNHIVLELLGGDWRFDDRIHEFGVLISDLIPMAAKSENIGGLDHGALEKLVSLLNFFRDLGESSTAKAELEVTTIEFSYDPERLPEIKTRYELLNEAHEITHN